MQRTDEECGGRKSLPTTKCGGDSGGRMNPLVFFENRLNSSEEMNEI